MSKLEEIMDQREANVRRSEKASRLAEEKRQEKNRRTRRLFERKEFNRLFKRLKTLVEGHWDKNKWGWTFKYRNSDYWISYDDWYCPKTPGDVDGYDMSGTDWNLKPHFNSSESQSYRLSNSRNENKDLTEAVLCGLKEFNKSDGRR